MENSKRFVFCAVVLFVSAGLVGAGAPPVGKTFRTIDDVLHNAKRREKVLISGTVKRSFDLETVLLADDKTEIAVSFVGVRQDVRPGDAIVVAGRFDSRSGYRSSYGLINALDWAPQTDPKVASLIERYGAVPTLESPVAVEGPSTPPTVPLSIESRLRALDDLKVKNLVTPDEYREQRKRILDQL